MEITRETTPMFMVNPSGFYDGIPFDYKVQDLSAKFMFAAEAVDKQVIRHPIRKELQYGTVIMWVCPRCKHCDHIEGREPERPERFRRYCCNCGQRLRS